MGVFCVIRRWLAIDAPHTISGRVVTVVSLTIFAVTAFFAVDHARASEVEIRVVGIEQVSGQIMVALCGPEEYPKGPCAIRAAIPANSTAETVRLTGVAPGHYALQVFQDLDGDRQLKKGFLGIPREPIGFGNDAPLERGPPSFEAASVTVGEAALATTVTLRNR